jgi:hypothetical protein
MAESNNSLLILAGLEAAAAILTQDVGTQLDTTPTLLLSGHYLNKHDILYSIKKRLVI